MMKVLVSGGGIATLLVVLAPAACSGIFEQEVDLAAAASVATPSSAVTSQVHPSLLYGRVSTYGGATYEGRLRFGGDEEAFWGHYFNGFKDENPWAAHVPSERLPKERFWIEIFAIQIWQRERRIDLGRPFMARFGDLARIEARGTEVRVTLKSGMVADLDRFSASDFDDGVRVWDGSGVVDLDSWSIRTIELRPPARPGTAPDRLHGTVRTRQGDFTGFLQWDREAGLGLDQLDGHSAGAELSLRFDTIRSIQRHSSDSARVTLLDGRQMVLSGTRNVGRGNRGIYIDDRRFGRVLVSWDAFERLDFSTPCDGPNCSGPAYDDFPAGRPLMGAVTTRAGSRLAGRLVYDLDESETTETLDAPSQGVDYTVPFGLIASLEAPGSEGEGASLARLTLHSGEQLQLEPTGDLGAGNAGILIFVNGGERSEYVPWTEVERVDFDRPPAMYPPLTVQ